MNQSERLLFLVNELIKKMIDIKSWSSLIHIESQIIPLKYIGMFAERNFGYKSIFISDDKIEHSR